MMISIGLPGGLAFPASWEDSGHVDRSRTPARAPMDRARSRRGRGTGGRGGGHTRAAAATCDVLVAVIVAALIAQALRGAEIWVLAGLAAIACITYLIAVLSISWFCRPCRERRHDARYAGVT